VKKINRKKYLLTALFLIVAVGIGVVYFNGLKVGNPVEVLSKPSEESFLAPGKDWPSEKKVEDYFMETLGMTGEEAQEVRNRPGSDGKVMLRIREKTTLDALLGNLEYYGFVRDKEALRYALEHTEDTNPGKAEPIMVGENTISRWAYYRISEDMTAWEIADELLNNPTYFSFDEYNYTFMP